MTSSIGTGAAVVVAVAAGWALWTLAEYLLHRFAMHHLRGRGIMSREHLEHHVRAGWVFSYTHPLSWAGMLLVGAATWLPLGWMLGGPVLGWSTFAGWATGYFFYELHHALAHLRPPSGRYGTWLRRHHFHHHFGNPMANHGVTTNIWDRAFATLEAPDRVPVPRRFAMAWLCDADGRIRSEFEGDYELRGRPDGERLAELDRIRAFASIAPVD